MNELSKPGNRQLRWAILSAVAGVVAYVIAIGIFDSNLWMLGNVLFVIAFVCIPLTLVFALIGVWKRLA